MTGAKSATFCSRGCASAGSVTEKRRRRAREISETNLLHDIHTIASGLRSREAWKYRKVREFLEFQKEPHEFEFVLGSNIHDLALTERKVIVEFDGHNHNLAEQSEEDMRRDTDVLSMGWDVHRVSVPMNQQIEPSVLYGILQPT